MICESSAGSNTAIVRGSLPISVCSLNTQGQNKLDHTIVMCQHHLIAWKQMSIKNH